MHYKNLAVTLLSGLLCVSPAFAQTQAETAEIRSKMTAFNSKNFGCTRVRKAMRKISAEHPAYHFAFAGRKAVTITGIRGCGYAWNTDLATARAEAMKNCETWELQYGTAGGTRICRLMR